MKANFKIENLGKSKTKEIYLAGGCFWGMEAYFQRISGVLKTETGYANGEGENASYKNLHISGHAETIRLVFDEYKISLIEILEHFFAVIDPTSLNKQGPDVGKQYRTGIYSNDGYDLEIAKKFINEQQNTYSKKIVVEFEKLQNYIKAEEYHQKYLDKNPTGYCHINIASVNEPLHTKYKKMSDEELKENLSIMQYNVCENSATEAPFTSELEENYDKGIYVDITSGEPLFASCDKFNSGCGWPSFSKPINSNIINYEEDLSAGRQRIEVRTSNSNIHLGHVFEDGPQDKGGLRYCINGAALNFIPFAEMDEKGYSAYKKYVE